jgi:hypothetical protein
MKARFRSPDPPGDQITATKRFHTDLSFARHLGRGCGGTHKEFTTEAAASNVVVLGWTTHGAFV